MRYSDDPDEAALQREDADFKAGQDGYCHDARHDTPCPLPCAACASECDDEAAHEQDHA